MAVGTFILYHYDPSFAAAVAFVAIFGIVTLGHAVQLVTFRTWFFIPFVIGGVFECIGYVGRAMSAKQTPGDWTVGPYIMQSLLLLLAPALFAASIYMILARIILLTDGEHRSIIRARWLTKIFVTGDVVSFFAQSWGGGMIAKAHDQNAVKLGNWVITGALIFQIVFFGFFVVVAGIFNYRLHRTPTDRSLSPHIPWQRYLFILYAASGLIMIRSVFRVVEYSGGQDGVLLSTEIYLYIFDGALMFLIMAIFNIFHPRSIIHKDGSHDFEQDIASSSNGRLTKNGTTDSVELR